MAFGPSMNVKVTNTFICVQEPGDHCATARRRAVSMGPLLVDVARSSWRSVRLFRCELDLAPMRAGDHFETVSKVPAAAPRLRAEAFRSEPTKQVQKASPSWADVVCQSMGQNGPEAMVSKPELPSTRESFRRHPEVLPETKLGKVVRAHPEAALRFSLASQKQQIHPAALPYRPAILEEGPGNGEVSLMLRNIACKYREQHIIESLNEAGLQGSFTAVHVPMNSNKRANLGYCFVTLTSGTNMQLYMDVLQGKTLGKTNSAKKIEVSMADVQTNGSPLPSKKNKNGW